MKKITNSLTTLLFICLIAGCQNDDDATIVFEKEYIWITDFGAVSNDESKASDNVVAIQKAIDYAETEKKGTVFFPSGTYWINNTINLKSNVSLLGESMETSIVRVSGTNSGFAAFSGGTETSSWGSFGHFKISEIHIRGDWGGSSQGQGTGGGIKLIHSQKVILERVQIDWFSGVCLHFKASGYSSINNCSISAAGFDCIWFESYNENDACTSTYVSESQVSTGIRSSFHISSGFNIQISKCQAEDSGTALLVDGIHNRTISFTENYVEATRGNYDVSIGSANGKDFFCHNNYLSGTPSISPFELPPLNSFFPLYIWGNGPFAPTPCRSDFNSPDC